MSVLVDTSVWSLALRRSAADLKPAQRRLLIEWRTLVTSGRAFMVGPIRQEILSGIRDHHGYQTLRTRLQFFDCISIVVDDYDQAAANFNALRSKGVIASPVDALICAVAQRCSVPIFTTDRDFERFAEYLPITLYGVSGGRSVRDLDQ